MILEILWIILLTISVGPIAFYLLCMWRLALHKPWGIMTDPNFEPIMSVLIPTYEEELSILKKLDNILALEYPKEKLDIVIVDSASEDKTASLASSWIRQHSEIQMQLIIENERRGMVPAMNLGLDYAKGDGIIKTDADCLLQPDSLRKALKYLADPSVGAVAGQQTLNIKRASFAVTTEKTYRGLYNIMRIGESKLFSSVLFEGELMMLRADLIKRIRFDEQIGADDLPTAIRLVENGFRAIVADDVFYIEQTPYTWREKLRQKIRRGRHLLQGFWKYKHHISRRTIFHKFLLPFETYIYMISPVLTLPFIALSIIILWTCPYFLLLLFFLLHSKVRDLVFTYFISILIMSISLFLELASREGVTWDKSEEIR